MTVAGADGQQLDIAERVEETATRPRCWRALLTTESRQFSTKNPQSYASYPLDIHRAGVSSSSVFDRMELTIASASY